GWFCSWIVNVIPYKLKYFYWFILIERHFLDEIPGEGFHGELPRPEGVFDQPDLRAQRHAPGEILGKYDGHDIEPDLATVTVLPDIGVRRTGEQTFLLAVNGIVGLSEGDLVPGLDIEEYQGAIVLGYEIYFQLPVTPISSDDAIALL